MRRIISVVILLLLYSHLAWAQTDSTVYRVALKTGKTLYGQIVAKEEGEYITLQKDDGGTQFLQWHEIEKYETTKYSLNSKELKEIAAKEAIAKKYANWNRGFLIVKSDTFFCWIEPKPDYSAIGMGMERTITTASIKGTEKNWEPEEYRKLVITEKDTVEYICYTPKNGKLNIFKIVNDGACKLLQDRYENDKEQNNSSAPIFIPNSAPGGTMIGGGPGLAIVLPKTSDRYYILYKGVWTKTKTDSGPGIDDYFRKKSKEIFTECPQLVKQLEDKTFWSDDIREIVKEFNSCISTVR
ncbi:MAG TPA: hypothetical protein VK154_01500 [Chitinophagales bacterium]|nr:hypothetical protein [Chitinophagales bacterium]